jgi:hypothetical protein
MLSCSRMIRLLPISLSQLPMCRRPVQPWMKEERDNTSRRGGPTYAAQSKPQYISASQRGFFRVHTSMWREREPEPEFSNFFRTPDINSTKLEIGFGNPLFSCYTRTTTYAGGTDSLEIFAFFKSLKIRALEKYVCLLRHTFTHSLWSKLMPNSENMS